MKFLARSARSLIMLTLLFGMPMLVSVAKAADSQSRYAIAYRQGVVICNDGGTEICPDN